MVDLINVSQIICKLDEYKAIEKNAQKLSSYLARYGAKICAAVIESYKRINKLGKQAEKNYDNAPNDYNEGYKQALIDVYKAMDGCFRGENV